MATTYVLTYSIYRTLGPLDTPEREVLAGIGAGIVDVDEMSWDEHLLSQTRWIDSIDTKPVYMPGRDRVYFTVHTDDWTADEIWLGHGSFPLIITRSETPSDNEDD